MANDVENFIEHKVLPPYRPVVRAFRQLVFRVIPDVTERMRGGTEKYVSVPVYWLNRDIIAISPTKKGVTFSFAKGASFDDPFGKLGGSGKAARTVRIAAMDEFDEQALTFYIKQAAELNRKARR